MPNSSDLSQGAAERAGYIHGLPESTQADFLSGRMGFAMGFDNTNQIMVDLWSEGFQMGDIPPASAVRSNILAISSSFSQSISPCSSNG